MNKVVFSGVVVLGLCIASSLYAAPTAGEADRASREEAIRRQEQTASVRAMINDGVNLCRDGKYAEAIAKLEGAIKVLPRSKATEADYKRALRGLNDVYCRMAEVAYKAGDMEKTRQLAQKALEYDAKDRTAEKLIARSNKVPTVPVVSVTTGTQRMDATPEFLSKKEQIKKLFRDGRVLLNSGQYDEAEKKFQQVLLIDPYNEDAHILIGDVNKARDAIAQIGGDSSHDRMLWNVSQAWIPPISREVEAPKMEGGSGQVGIEAARSAAILEKINSIIFPEINFRDANIKDVCQFLSEESRRLDPKQEGVNIVLQLGGASSLQPPPVTPPADGSVAPVAPAAGGLTVSLTLHSVPMIEALKYITTAVGLKYRIQASAVLIMPKDVVVTGELITRSYPVSPGAIRTALATPTAAPAATGGGAASEVVRMGGSGTIVNTGGDVKEYFRGTGVPFPEGSSCTYNDRTSTIMIRNTAENLDVFERILADLNVPPSQVEIEAKYVEISQDDLNSLGFRWNVGNYNISDNYSAIGGGTYVDKNGLVHSFDDITSGLRGLDIANTAETFLAPGVLGTFSGILQDSSFKVLLKALSQKGVSDTLSSPKITTLSGNAATIKVVREIIYPTSYTRPEIAAAGGGSGGGSATVGAVSSIPENFKTREAGVILNVTPTVGPDGWTINLTLVPEVSELIDWLDYSSTNIVNTTTSINTVRQPVFETRTLTTSIIIWDGQTVVLGGLMKDNVVKVDDKVPLLGDIPVLGRLFRSKSTTRGKRNLLIFVTARLIDPAGNLIHRQK